MRDFGSFLGFDEIGGTSGPPAGGGGGGGSWALSSELDYLALGVAGLVDIKTTIGGDHGVLTIGSVPHHFSGMNYASTCSLGASGIATSWVSGGRFEINYLIADLFPGVDVTTHELFLVTRGSYNFNQDNGNYGGLLLEFEGGLVSDALTLSKYAQAYYLSSLGGFEWRYSQTDFGGGGINGANDVTANTVHGLYIAAGGQSWAVYTMEFVGTYPEKPEDMTLVYDSSSDPAKTPLVDRIDPLKFSFMRYVSNGGSAQCQASELAYLAAYSK